MYRIGKDKVYFFVSFECCDESLFFFGFTGGLRFRSTIHRIEPAATSQNMAIQIPNHVPLYHGLELTGVGVGVVVGVGVGVTDAVDAGMYVGVTVVVDVGMPDGDAVCVGVEPGASVGVAVSSGVCVSVGVGSIVGVALDE